MEQIQRKKLNVVALLALVCRGQESTAFSLHASPCNRDQCRADALSLSLSLSLSHTHEHTPSITRPSE